MTNSKDKIKREWKEIEIFRVDPTENKKFPYIVRKKVMIPK